MHHQFNTPTVKDHIDEAQRNYRFCLRLLEEGEELGWAAVVLFYSALHLVQAYSVKREEVCASHEERDDFIFDHLQPISRTYRRLRAEADRARYQLRAPNAKRLRAFHDEDFLDIVKELKRRNIFWEDEEGGRGM